MLLPLFFCLGFCIGILYIDLVFDVSSLPYRKTRTPLPENILNPVTTYYRYVTKNPWLLIFVMAVTLTCIVVEIRYSLVPSWIAYSSLAIFGIIALLAIVRVIPGAQQLASGKESAERQTRLAHSLFSHHLVFLILILSLALLQLSTARP